MIRVRRMIPLFLASLILIGSGCTAPPQGRQRATPTDPGQRPTNNAATAKRFQDTPLEGRTAVESAIELSEKYARLSDQTIALREENQQLVVENEALQQQIATLEAKLRQTQKELGEANDLLIEMLTELNNWKTNILGFRGEMRQAAKAQLEALLKVLEILGGEAGGLESQHAGVLNPGSADTSLPNSSATGEPNAP